MVSISPNTSLGVVGIVGRSSFFPSPLSSTLATPIVKKKMSAFCGEYSNSTRIDERLGVLGNECFLNGLSFVPNIVFVLVAVPVLISWNKSIFASMHVKTWVRFPHHVVRWMLFFVLVIVNVLEVVAGFMSDELLGGAHLHLFIPHMVSVSGTLMAVVYYHSVEMWNSPRFLFLLIPYWFFLMVVEVMKTMNLNLSDVPLDYMRPHFTRASIVLYLLLLLVELDLLRQLRYAFFKKRRILKPPEYLADTNYVQSAVSLPSKATYFWISSLVNQACKTPLELKDLGPLPKSERSGYNYGQLVAAIEEEREKQAFDERIWTSLFKSCWLKSQGMMLLAGVFMLVGTILHLATPILLIQLLNCAEREANTTVPVNVTLPKEGDMVEVNEFFSDGYVLSILMFLCCVVMSTSLQAGNYVVIREGVRIRGALQLLMYGKVLTLSLWNFASKTMTIPQVTSLMSTDVNNILFCSCVFHFIWLLPLKTLAAVAMLYSMIGLSALIGMSVVLLLTFLQWIIATRLSRVQQDISKLAETRVKKCTEMLQNIKCLKLYAWENVVAKNVEEARSVQIKAMFAAALLKALTTFISEASNLMVLLVAFCVYPYIERESLSPQKVFPAIILFDIIGSPIHIFPILLSFIDHAISSTKRIASFLTSYEIESKRHHTSKPKFHKASSYLQHSMAITISQGSKVAGSRRSSESDGAREDGGKVKMVVGGSSGDEEDGGSMVPKVRKSFGGTNGVSKSGGSGKVEEISMSVLESESRRSMLGPQSAAILASQLSVIHEAEQQHQQRQQQQQHSKPDENKKSKRSNISGGKTGKSKKNKKQTSRNQPGKSTKEPFDSTANNNFLVKAPENETFGNTRPSPADFSKVEISQREKTVVSAMLSVPSVASEMDRSIKICTRSCSRRASQHDMMSVMMTMMTPGNKRTSSVISASNSMGSGLDDDDLIDPNRDVGVAVDVNGGYFAWEPDSPEPLLTEIDFKADAGRLTVIVGAVGSGKSSLISAVLGEMNRMSGTITWKPGLTTCYSGSTPWLLNNSLQENILLGQPMEKKRYKRVLRACALQQDIDILPEKDLTEIGSKGISLSLGQRLRVSIARAIYSKADLVVLDDPFSALDLATASHIFEDGILHFCLVKRRRTVVLVTHELHFLPFAQAIFQVENGCLQFHGRLQDVKENNPQLFAVWQEGLRQARKENQLRTEREETTNTERLVLLRKIRTLEFRRELAKSLLSEDKKGDSPKRVFLTGQTTHITIEEEHPGVEDVPVTNQKAGVDDDDDDTAVEFDQGMTGIETIGRTRNETKSLMIRKKRQQQQLMMMDITSRPNGVVKNISLVPTVRLSWRALFMYAMVTCPLLSIFLIICHLGRVFLLISSDVWLSHWCSEVARNNANKSESFFEDASNQIVTVSLTYDMPLSKPDEAFVEMYAILVCAAILFSLVISFCTELVSLRSSHILYLKMLRSVVQAPMKFFDANPISKIMSRFSGDINIIDEKLITTLEHFLRTLLLLVGSVVVNGYVTLYFLVPGLLILLAFSYYQYRFRLAYRELHKLDSMTKAPLLSHCSETLTGLRTIRAFHDEIRFWNIMEQLVNNNNSSHLWLNTANRWIGIRLDYLASMMVLMSSMVSIAVGSSSSLVGLGITYTLLMCGYVNWVVRSVSDADVQMTAIQHFYEYCHLPSENHQTVRKSEEVIEVDDDWPLKGELIFYNVSILYSGHAIPVARNINIHIRPGEKVGICGKPGSGKSSLILSLFGLVDLCEGSIYIDGCKINNVKPSILRSRLAVLPQDCMLLSGTVRFNLDPEGIHSDESIWEVLDQVSLKDTIKYLSGQLEAVVNEDGENFSISDKQLLCLARAILKKSKFIIIDEVMSVLNRNVEEILQRVLRTAFNDRTVINLSHRPASLMDYDTVVVLDNGLVVEHDTPQNLAKLEGGVFASLLKKKPL